MKSKRVFISDIHLSSKKLYEHPNKPSWFKPEEHEPRFLRFLENYVLANRDEIKDVVLLGDFCNTWMCPADVRPPSYRRILRDNPKICDQLKELVIAGIGLFYINGNHDFDLTPREIENEIAGLQAIKYYRSGRLHAEHGHRYDPYNRPDYRSDPAFGRPIGYFISRLAASTGETEYGLLDLPAYIDDVLEAALTSQTIFSSIIEAMAERAGLKETDGIVMTSGRKMRIRDLKTRYQGLGEIYSLSELISALFERRYMHGTADRLCKRMDLNVVVLGHTHNALLDKDWFLTENRIYANTGSWCKDNAYCVEIDKKKDRGEPVRVCLLKIDAGGQIADSKCEEVVRCRGGGGSPVS